jgi:UDP-glucose 4-epimerase
VETAAISSSHVGKRLRLPKSRILVTGGAGFVGSHLVDRLLKDGHDVDVVDDLTSGSLGNLKSRLGDPRLTIQEGDFADPKFLQAELPKTKIVVHLAALTSVSFSVLHPGTVFKVNALKTHTLLQACVKHSVGRFILASTAAVYGNQSPPVSESVSLDPLSPYASSKASAEALVQSFYHSFGLESVILRFMNVYGPRSKGAAEGVITKFVGAFKEKDSVVVYGDGEQTRDFVHVSDVVDSIALAIITDHSHADVFNVGTGHPTSINELIALFRDLMPTRQLKVSYLPKRKGEVRHSFASTFKASHSLGFNSRIELGSGLAELLKEERIP